MRIILSKFKGRSKIMAGRLLRMEDIERDYYRVVTLSEKILSLVS